MTPVDFDLAAAAVLSWLLTYAIHSTILLAGAAVAAWRFADHHAWLDLIWKAAVIAPLVTASLPVDAIALPPSGRWAMPVAMSVASDDAGPKGPAPRTTVNVRGAGSSHPADAGHAGPKGPAPRTTVNARGAGSSDPADDGHAGPKCPAPRSWRRWPLIAAIAWLVIASVLVLRYARQLRRVHRALGTGSPVTSADVLEPMDRLAAGRRAIRLSMSAVCPVPLALSRGRIVLPPRFLDELDREQQQAALAHELAHVIRRDPEWRIAIDIIERVLCFQPLNRLARARLSDAAEFLCDEWAVQQTQSPLALARCLSVVASWWTPADRLPAGVSAMARSDSAMVQRVTRILNEPARMARRPRVYWLAIPVALVAVGAPRVTATQLPAAVSATAAVAAVLAPPAIEKAAEQREPMREWSAAEIAAARAQLRVHRVDRPGASLDDRWRQALTDAGRQGLSDFWVAYTFDTPAHGDEVMLGDTRDGSFIFSSNGRLAMQGPSLAELINPSAVPLEGGNLVVLLHYRGARADAIDRAGYRSVQLGFDFGRTPVFWLGDAPESQSFDRVQNLFGAARDRKIQGLLIKLAALHGNSDVVIPFLTRLVAAPWPPEIRSEAAEGFDRHHDPRSVEILLRVARTDPDSGVRAEAAETIGDVQVPESIPALTALVNESADPAVRHEAAEGFGSQPAARALPAIETVIANNPHEDVLNEAIEAIGELGDQAGVPLLVHTATTHPNLQAQKEAVETLGDLDQVPGVVDALTRVAWEHTNVEVQRQAVETLGDRRDDAGAMAALERIVREHDREDVQAEAIETLNDGPGTSLHPLILEVALSGRSARVRREALDAIGEAVEKLGDAQLLDRAQSVIERAVFSDPDQAVRLDALDALEKFPGDRAMRVLRDVIARHPDARVRREAEEHVRERQ